MRKLTLFLAALSLSFYTSAQQQPKTGILEYEGNRITVAYEYETIAVEDPENGNIVDKVLRHEKFELLNGSQIYQGQEASEPIGSANQLDLENFLRNLLSDELKQIRYFRKTLVIIVDEKGKLAYFQSVIGNHPEPYELASKKIEPGEKQALIERISKKLHSQTFIPAKKDGAAVPYSFYLSS